MANVHYLQHVPFEGLGSIGDCLGASGHRIDSTRVYAGETLPNVADLDWLIVMGGPMSVNDTGRYEWLIPERRLIEEAVKQDKVVLGICLGAQLLAQVLGAKIYPNKYKEIGWFQIQRTPEGAESGVGSVLPEEAEVFHWHGETFDLPAGAVRLARSDVCENQGFLYERQAIAFQFHLETTWHSAKQLIENCSQDLDDGPYVQSAESILSDQRRFDSINEMMRQVLIQLGS